MYEKSLTTIANMLDAARYRFVNSNYDDITMTDIAEDAGVTKGAIYHHFDSKQHLYLTMMHRYLEDLRDKLQVAVNGIGTARERLTHLTTIYLELPLIEQKVIQLVRRDNSRFSGGERDELIRAYQDALPKQIEKIIQDGIDTGEIAAVDARILSWQHVAIVEVGLSTYARERLGAPVEMAKYLTDMFMDGAGRK